MDGQTPDGLYRRMVIRAAVVLAAAALLLTVGVWVFKLLLPFLAAWLAAWVLNGAASAVRRRVNIPHKTTSMLIAVLLFLGGALLLGYLGWRVATEAMALRQGWQTIFQDVTTRLETIGGQLRRLSQEELDLLNQFSATLQTAISGLMDSLSDGVMDWVGERAKQVPAVVLVVLVFAFATFLITADYANLYEKFNRVLSRDPEHPIHTVKHILKGAFGDYLGKLLGICLVVMMVDLVGLLLLGVRYAALLALAMGILDFLPYVGSGTVLIPWGIVCLLSGEPLRGLGLLALYGVVRAVRYRFSRRFDRKRAEFGMFITLICVFLGWKLWGFIGILLGPVVVMILVNLYHSGFFDAAIEDCRLAVRDIRRRMGLPETE
jgi:sporulation integral membrane protein YtvI